MLEFLDQYGYFAITIGTFFEGETVILLASSLSNTGLFSIPQTVFFGFFGSFISDWVYYLIGRFNGKYFVDRRPKLKSKVEPVTRFFDRNKVQILFSYRFLYGFRIIIPIVIGMSGFRPVRFLGYSLLSGLVWAATVSAVGYWVGRIFEVDLKIFEDKILLLVLFFASFGFAIGYLIKRVTAKDVHTA